MTNEIRERQVAELAKAAGLKLLTLLPKTIPPDRVLVHNRVRMKRLRVNGYTRVLPTTSTGAVLARPHIGRDGFRAWLSEPNPTMLRLCDCGWARELGPHFRVIKTWAWLDVERKR